MKGKTFRCNVEIFGILNFGHFPKRAGRLICCNISKLKYISNHIENKRAIICAALNKITSPSSRHAAVFILLLLVTKQTGVAQTGYIYVHAKTISEDINQSFIFSVTGGSTSVPNFTLLDQNLNIEPTDIGAGHGNGGGELWVVTGATRGADGTVYHRAANSAVWNAVSGQTGAAIDGADLGHFVLIRSNGDGYVYNGSSFIKFFDHSTYTTAVDIANNGSITSGAGYTAIVGSNGHVYRYTGNYSTTFTWTDITPVDKSGLTFKRLDVNPANNDIVLNDAGGNVTKVNSSGGGLVYYGRGGSAPSQLCDVTIDDNGTMYAVERDGQGMDAAYRYNGTGWDEEPETGLHYFLTCSNNGQVWIIKGNTAAQSSSFANQSTIYSRTGDGSGTWLDDERVVTSQNGNSIMIPVNPGTYTITEASPSNWNLQKIDLYDSAAGSTIDVAANKVTVVVGAGQVAHAVFTTGIVGPRAIPSNCNTDNSIQNFGSGVNPRGNALTGLTDFHFYSNASYNTTPDGYYSLTQNSLQWGNATLTDHSGLVGGYFLMVNASYAPNEFYRQRVTGMAPGATYNFTFWAANLSPGSPLQPDILAGVTDTSSGATLGSVSTGPLPTDNGWHQYTFSFKATVTTGDLFLQNNAPGGFGNDLAIDDINLNQVCNSVLAVGLTNFNVTNHLNHPLLTWTLGPSPDLNYFEVERSTDKGATWKMIGIVMGSDDNTTDQDYVFKDDHPEDGINLYRLKTDSKTGAFVYSAIKQIEILNLVTLSVYPNPIGSEKVLNVQLSNLVPGTYKISLVSSSGQSVKKITYKAAGTGTVSLPITTAAIPGGTYVLTVNGNNQEFSKPIVIENR